ncbi:hypothetical protein [Kitasatospora sp. MBT63]|uniref:hypothetical protein n=1 Tax=Kitasatospora sp. MBT63 TaxID=1444768 RepID=UPI00053980C0|nr:hypothetical protein [Kitasatospora sp. MBT63]
MADTDTTQTEDRDHAPAPWWAELGTWGSVGLIVLGAVAAVWVSFRLPGTPEELASGYYQAARVVAIGLVTVGCALLGRRRARAAAVDGAGEQERG